MGWSVVATTHLGSTPHGACLRGASSINHLGPAQSSGRSLTLSGEEFVDSGIEAERLTRVAAFAEGDVERA